jgi:hypothetical protein
MNTISSVLINLTLRPPAGPRDEGTILRAMALKRMDNMGIVVEDLGAAIGFFLELGMELEGTGMVEGEWAGRVTGLGDPAPRKGS